MLNLAQKKELLKNLPEALREAIDSVENIEKVEAIGKDNRLLLDQIGELDNVITETIFGVIKTEDFVKEVRQRVGVDFEVAEKLKDRVDTEIFRPIKEFLVNRPSATEKKAEAQEEEDESLISRESLLQEIENPSRSTFKTAPAAPSLAETHSAKTLGATEKPIDTKPAEELIALPVTIDPSHEIAAPGTVTPATGTKPAEAVPTPTPPVTPAAKQPAETTPTSAPITTAPITQTPRTVTEIKPTQPPKNRTIDPYREPIE